MGADARVLDHGRAAAEDGVVAHRAMPGEHDVAGEDHVVADAAVVPDVVVGEEGATVADRRGESAARRAGVHRDAFADDAVGADDEGRRLAPVLEVLRLVADGGEGEDARVRADARAPGHDRVADELDPLTERDLSADRAVGPDPHPLAELGAILDDRGGGSASLARATRACSQGPRFRRVGQHRTDLGFRHRLAVDPPRRRISTRAPDCGSCAHGSAAGRPAAPAFGTWRGSIPMK